MSLNAKPAFDAVTVVALKVVNETRRMEIRFADADGIEQVVSLPITDAVELARLTLDASTFMAQLKEGPSRSVAQLAARDYPGFSSLPASQG
ncbi:MAG TPA: hypothetical protein VH600_17780 [Burkholderiales bacterium]